MATLKLVSATGRMKQRIIQPSDKKKELHIHRCQSSCKTLTTSVSTGEEMQQDTGDFQVH